MKETNEVRPFGIRDRIGYAFGDVANDFTFILSSSFLLKFYTDVMGVSPAIVGLMMMACRFVDAFTDITMGRIVDTAKVGKNGKFRPWILRAAGPVAVMSFLMYATWFRNMPMTFKIVWMFATYLLWGSVFYTMVNVPYGSMASGITADPRQRTQLSVARTVGATIASMCIGVVIPMVAYYKDADGNQVFDGGRFSVIALICSILAIVSYLVCYFNVTERVHIEPPKKGERRKNNFIKNIFTNRALLALIAANICLLLSQLTIGQMANYVYPNYYGNVHAQSMMSLAGSIITFALAPFATAVATKFGKKEVGVVAAIIASCAFFTVLVIRPENVWVYFVFNIMGYFGLDVFNLVNWAFMTDVIDYAELKNGIREDATTYSTYSFSRKLAQAASAGLTGGLLTLAGYTKASAFNPAVTSKIFTIACLIPAVGFALVAVIMLFWYPLNRAAVEANSKKLFEKHASEEK